jgi:hypothetical protein
LFGVCAYDEVDLMCGRINLFEQPLQINCAAGTGRGDHKFHLRSYPEFEFNPVRAQ